MKKIIITAILMVFSTFSAKAIDLSMFSVTGGLASNTSIWSGKGEETGRSETGTIDTVISSNGMFTESFQSQFVELGVTKWVSFGYSHTPGSISSPTNESNEKQATSNTVQVDFNDFDTTYIKLNIPGGVYIKIGSVSTDLDVKETMASGNTYANVSVDGDSTGLGYQGFIGESGFGFRMEMNYIDLDNATTTNGVAVTGNQNSVHASHMEGATASLAVTYTFGRD
jgi:hypothetical protein